MNAPNKRWTNERIRNDMYMKVNVTYGTIVLNKYADLPFRNFYFYLSDLAFYFSDYTEYNIGVFLNISKKN